MTSSDSAAFDSGQAQVIEWDMMDKWKFYPLSLACSVTVRGFLYPLTVVKTRLQIQKQQVVYRGTFDAFRKIFRSEGLPGLYKGYWINTIQVFSGVAYVSTYEWVRHFLKDQGGIHGHAVRGLIAGGCASAVGQTIIVPFDVISQHMMIIGNLRRKQQNRITDPLNISNKMKASRLPMSFLVTREILRRDGLIGLYRGYLASLLCYVPNSASFWWLYHFYVDRLNALAPASVPHLMVQCVAAPCSGLSTSVVTNCLDLLRARLQVQRDHLIPTVRRMWKEEGLGIFCKGLSARLIASCLFSFFIILGYESLKRVSVRSDYKHKIRW